MRAMRWNGISIGAAFVLLWAASARGEPPAPASPPAEPAQQAAPPGSASAVPALAPPPPPPANPEAASPEVANPEAVNPAAEPSEPAAAESIPVPRAPSGYAAVAPRKDDWIAGVDLGLGPIPGLSAELVRVSVGGRFGYRLNAGHLFVVPEGVLGFVEVVEKQQANWFHSEQAWFGAGLRGGVGVWRLEVSLYSHAYGWFAGGADYAVDGGGALDFRLSPTASLGAHASVIYAHDEGNGAVTYGVLGLHADFMR